MVDISEKYRFHKSNTIETRWKSVDMPKAVDFIFIQIFAGLNPGDSVWYWGGERGESKFERRYDTIKIHF